MNKLREFYDFIYTIVTNWLKLNWRIAVAASIFICLVLAVIYVATHRPSFSASHHLGGSDEARLYVVETQVPANSRVTMNGKISSLADNNGSAVFNILPNELSRGTNKLEFKVKVPYGLSKTYAYYLEKDLLPITLKVKVNQDIKNYENYKILSVTTDPLNKIYIEQLTKQQQSETGQEVLVVKDYDVLQLAGPTETGQQPDLMDLSVNVGAVDVDGQVKITQVPLKVTAFTKLKVTPPAETEKDTVSITGMAAPGAVVNASGQKTTAGSDGTFKVTVPLPEYGPNKIQFAAARPGEKPAAETVTVNKLLPLVSLSVAPPKLDGPVLALEGTTTSGASVTVNSLPAVVEGNHFTWFWTLPPEESRDYTFKVEAQKEGFRAKHITVDIPRKPVYRQDGATSLLHSGIPVTSGM